MTTFTGFSEEDLARIKSETTKANSVTTNATTTITVNGRIRKVNLPSMRKKISSAVKPSLSHESIDDIQFDKCRLSIKSPASEDTNTDENTPEEEVPPVVFSNTSINSNEQNTIKNTENPSDAEMNNNGEEMRTETRDMRRGLEYSEVDLSVHKAKLEELQLKQRLMEEQNKKRKEMLARALADRTRQTEEEVQKLEKIKKELQVLDGQFSQDVAVLRKKIDQACLSYADAEKHYLKVEKEFLQAKIQLQKEKEKKELLTEHLCALITHNETRKAQKLETLMLELATNKKMEDSEPNCDDVRVDNRVNESIDNEDPVVIDGVDQRTGKMVEFNGN